MRFCRASSGPRQAPQGDLVARLQTGRFMHCHRPCLCLLKQFAQPIGMVGDHRLRRNRRPWRWMENNLPAPRRLIKNLEPPGPKTQKPNAELTRRHASPSCSVMNLSNMTRQLGQVSTTQRSCLDLKAPRHLVGATSPGTGLPEKKAARDSVEVVLLPPRLKQEPNYGIWLGHS